MTTINRFALGEIYHCYNRGVDKRITFNTSSDYVRFMELLFLCNDTNPKQRSTVSKLSHAEIFNLPRNNQLVSIGSYCLMPNHFHLLLKERVEGGISTFMGILGNSYTKYFNIKNKRTGNLFNKPFLAKHIHEDNHFSHIAQYIHINPAELLEPRWKEGVVLDINKLESFLTEYTYSSLSDFLNINRLESKILDKEFADSLKEDLPQFSEILDDMFEYYKQLR